MIQDFNRDIQLATECIVKNWNVSIEQSQSPIYDVSFNQPLDFISGKSTTKYSVELLCQQNYNTLIEKIEHVAFCNGFYLNNIEMVYSDSAVDFIVNLFEDFPQTLGALMDRHIVASHNFVKINSKYDPPTNRIFQFSCVCKECGMHGSMCSVDNLQIYAENNMSCNDRIIKEVLQ